MQRILICLALLIVLCAGSGAEAQETGFLPMKDTAAFRKNLREHSARLQSMVCDFVQHKVSDLFNTPVEAQGRFWFAGEGRIRWEYTRPFTWIIIIYDGKVTLKDEKNTSRYDLSGNKAFAEIAGQLNAIMDGSIADQQQGFDIRYLESDKQYLVELSAAAAAPPAYFSAVRVYFGRAGNLVEALSLTDQSGDTTMIYFQNIITNQQIPDEKFIVR
jgi:outer membrane lipoprotein-sorting protein